MELFPLNHLGFPLFSHRNTCVNRKVRGYLVVVIFGPRLVSRVKTLVYIYQIDADDGIDT